VPKNLVNAGNVGQNVYRVFTRLTRHSGGDFEAYYESLGCVDAKSLRRAISMAWRRIR
jgi:hypothetical protein